MTSAAEAAAVAAGPAAYRATPWFFLCGPLAASVFALGLALNLRVFERHALALHRVLDMRRDEVPTSHGMALFALALFVLQLAVFTLERWRRGGEFHASDERGNEALLLLYAAGAGLLLVCPFDVCHRKFRQFLVRRLGRCLWPFQRFGGFQLPAHPTPFVEVFIADGLTSLSKFIQDGAVALLLFALALTTYADDGRLREAYMSKMKASPLPYLAASVPYIIRATQCLISFHRTTSVAHRSMHLLNTIKYCSSLLVISVGAYPQVMGHAKPEKSSLFLLCAVFNSLYSFVWDVIMDWGLGQPKLPRKRAFLRHQLLYRPHNIYYLVIAVDFALRILWVTKWWDWLHDGVDFRLVSQVAEAVRRIIWNFFRVEWQCLKLEALGPAKKLSGDEAEIEASVASMETVPLTTEDEEDEFGSELDRDSWRKTLIDEMVGNNDANDSDNSDSEEDEYEGSASVKSSQLAYRRTTRGNSIATEDESSSLEAGELSTTPAPPSSSRANNLADDRTSVKPSGDAASE